MNVSFTDFGKSYLAIKSEIDSAIHKVISTGNLILREDVEQFEENLAKFVGTNYAVGVNSGTDALFLSLKVAGVGQGDEVITVGHTFHATVEAIHWNGATPILVDVGDDGMMDIEAVRKAITQKTKAVMPVHLMGDMVDVEELQKFVGWTDDIEIIEDACQALGSERDGKKAGAWGLTGCFSFYPAKILGAYGDAGAITTNNESLAKELKDMRNHYKYNPGKFGFNSRLDNLQAAVLNVKIKYLPFYLEARKKIAELYDELLGDIKPSLTYPTPSWITLPTKRDGRVYQDYIIRTSKRDELAQFLKDNGIETMKNDYHFPDSLSKPEATVLLESQTLRLPCNPFLTQEEVEYVAGKINEFFKRI